MPLEVIAPGIERILPQREPLSSDAFIIRGDSRYYVFDVGASDAAFEALSALDKPVTVILSHFHRDHTANLSRLSPDEVLVGARTRKQLSLGTLVDAPVTIHDGVTIMVQPCVSPHAPGCLIATVNGAYTLIGDLHYARPGTGQGEAKGMLNVLRRLETEWFVVSHEEGNPLISRENLLNEIRGYYGIK